MVARRVWIYARFKNMPFFLRSHVRGGGGGGSLYSTVIAIIGGTL